MLGLASISQMTITGIGLQTLIYHFLDLFFFYLHLLEVEGVLCMKPELSTCVAFLVIFDELEMMQHIEISQFKPLLLFMKTSNL